MKETMRDIAILWELLEQMAKDLGISIYGKGYNSKHYKYPDYFAWRDLYYDLVDKEYF